MIGEKYGRLTVLSFSSSGKRGSRVEAVCECGIIKEYQLSKIACGHTKSCGCYRREDSSKFIGFTYGRLTVLEDLGVVKKFRIVSAKCECGNIKEYYLNSLRKGNTKSCGCFKDDVLFKHGLSKHPLHKVWTGMIDRCRNHKRDDYERYGGRGVDVCIEWKNDFLSFYNWALPIWRPGLELDKDKLSPTGSGLMYSPDFCCFLTPKENSRNRRSNFRIEYMDTVKTLTEWCEMFKISCYTARARMRAGWSIDRAFREPIKKKEALCQ